MAPENAQLILQSYAAFNSRDLGVLEGLMHPDFEVDLSSSMGFDRGSYAGEQGLRRFFESYWDAFESISIEVEALIGGGDRIVAMIRATGRGQGSGAEVDARGPHLWSFRDGRVVGLAFHGDLDEALAAAALANPDGLGKAGAAQPASGGNAELVRDAVAAADRRDLAALEALWSEDCEFRSTFAASEGRVFRGLRGIRDYFATLDDAFEDVRLRTEEAIDVDEARVVLLVRVTGRGKASGVPAQHLYGQLWTLARGRVTRIDSYLDPGQALEAAGLAHVRGA